MLREARKAKSMIRFKCNYLVNHSNGTLIIISLMPANFNRFYITTSKMNNFHSIKTKCDYQTHVQFNREPISPFTRHNICMQWLQDMIVKCKSLQSSLHVLFFVLANKGIHVFDDFYTSCASTKSVCNFLWFAINTMKTRKRFFSCCVCEADFPYTLKVYHNDMFVILERIYACRQEKLYLATNILFWVFTYTSP